MRRTIRNSPSPRHRSYWRYFRLQISRRRRKNAGEKQPAQRPAAGTLGPTFIKLGQALSTRSDLIGDELADDLSGLRDNLPPFPTAIARAIIEQELQAPLSIYIAKVRRHAGRRRLDRAGAPRCDKRRQNRRRQNPAAAYRGSLRARPRFVFLAGENHRAAAA